MQVKMFIMIVGGKEKPMKKKETKPSSDRDLSQRLKDYKETYKKTGDHKTAIRSYCAGNKWLTENAKAVGNW